MNILFCNPKNSQGTTHSRKGMYAPLGILSVATVLTEKFGNEAEITVWDEDVETVNPDAFAGFDLAGFYSTTFNYSTCVEYATIAKSYGCTTVLGGPHSTVLAQNILRNQTCFDFVIRFEAETPMTELVNCILTNDKIGLSEVPNMVYQEKGKIVFNKKTYENKLEELPFPSREFVPFESYIRNYQGFYSDKGHIRPASLYSSKGCSWRDKTGGCVFCARLEEGVRFRNIDQIWSEIQMLRDRYDVNSIWDISDDNLNNKKWFKKFVRSRPSDCEDLSFFIYSRVGFITPEVIPYFKELNVEEVFLGVESGDNKILNRSFKGQTAKMSLRATRLLKENNIKYFPSFILGLPGESRGSMENTYRLCQQLADMGGLDRLGCTILQPIPGSPSYDMLLKDEDIGNWLKDADEIDLSDLEKSWVEKFTETDHATTVAYRCKINELMKDFMVFGSENAAT